MKLNVNDTEYEITEPWGDESLLMTLREHLGFYGPKYGCGIGACRACLVHIDNKPQSSCLVRTKDVTNSSILTIEGLGGVDENDLHPVQTAWIEEKVPQCGYCQSGQMMQAAALLEQNANPTSEQIDAAMNGNLCRCGTYPRIKKAISRAASLSRQT